MPASATLSPVSISEEERSFLSSYLERALHDKMIEEHRTENFAFREFVKHEIALLRGLIEKLKPATASAT
jgi:hypothetical protein